MGYKCSSAFIVTRLCLLFSNPALARVKKRMIRSGRAVARPLCASFHSCLGFASPLPPRIATGLMPIGTCSPQDRHHWTIRSFKLLRFGTIPAGGFRLVDGLSGQPSLLLGGRMHEPKCYIPDVAGSRSVAPRCRGYGVAPGFSRALASGDRCLLLRAGHHRAAFQGRQARRLRALDPGCQQ